MALHPQAVAALELAARGPSVADPGFGPAELAAMRAGQRAVAAAEPREPVARVEDVDADGVRCRLHAPDAAARTLVYLHGGGFALGDLDTHDAQARRLANRTGSAVVSVDYRRPPEHPFPAAPDDVDTVLGWLAGPGRDLAPGPTVAVGDSAGANLVLVAALRNPGAFAACVLVYPFLDPTTAGASYARADGGLTRAEANWYWARYAGSPQHLTDPDLAPLRSERLGGLPATLVQIAEHDVLVDEDAELVRRLEEAGVGVQATTYAGMVHGFWRQPAAFDAAEPALAEVAAFLAAHG